MWQRKTGGEPVERGGGVGRSDGPQVGKQTLVAQAEVDGDVRQGSAPPADVASRGVATGASQMPHLDRIQASFGPHDVSGVRSHQGADATEASQALGARAYAFGDAVAFGSSPDLHTAAHEAAHVVQQRAGVQLEGGLDQPGDAYERHADAVADAVVAGRSAAGLLDQLPGGSRGAAAVQRQTDPGSVPGSTGAEITPPTAAINKVGFIDTSDGANVRTGPAESGGQLVRPQPLLPATRVFVSGTHPDAPGWWYVTAFLGDAMVRGYVQGLRVTTDLPEPTAELHQVVTGDTAEGLAAQKFSGAVTDGHDLRYYENVLLYVNQQAGRVGITGSYQDPNVLGRGSNNIQLVAGHRIWLPSAAYARTLESVVPSGSLTGGAVAKVKRFAGHLEDILRSVTDSPSHLGEVAGQYAEAIEEHAVEITGIVAGFLAAEAASAFLAATPTGVGQIAAVVIQLGLTAFGVAGMVQATADALGHAGTWLSTAWTANGDDAKIAEASREFIRMLVSIALAALAYLGAKGSAGKAIKIADSIPTSELPVVSNEVKDPVANDPTPESPTTVEPEAPGEPVVIKSEAGRPIGEYSPGEYLKLILSRGKQALFGGNTIELEAGRTTTVTGTLDDVNTVAARGQNDLGITKMGENPGAINILRSARWAELQNAYAYLLDTEGELAYWKTVTDEFWNTVNRPWLDEAIERGDAFRFVSDPADAVKTFVTDRAGNFILDAGDKIRSIFGRELDYLASQGYKIEGATAVKPN